MTAKRLQNLLNPCENGDLGAIVRRARAVGDLTAALVRAVGPEDGISIVAANLRDDGELVVLCASPARAARLRFLDATLLEAARAHGADARRCTVRVARSE